MTSDWEPSVFYGEGVVDVPIELAWKLMIDYEGYNPTFEGSTVTLVEGERDIEGGLVVIQKVDHDSGVAARPFYCKTAKFQPPSAGGQAHIVWYLWDDADEMRNFVDFGLREDERGVVFFIDYYAQGRLTGDALAESRKVMTDFTPKLIGIFQEHCRKNAA